MSAPTLAATATTNGHATLLVRYEVANWSGQPLYLFNQQMQLGAASVFDSDPNTVEVVLRPDRVVVRKILPTIPDDMEVERPYIPCLSRVESGSSFTEVITLPLPLAPFAWYGHFRPCWPAHEQVPVQRPLYLELGYALPEANSLISWHQLSGGGVHYASWFPVAYQARLGAGPLLPAVAVLPHAVPPLYRG